MIQSPVYYLYSFGRDKIFNYWFCNEKPHNSISPDDSYVFSARQIYSENPNLFICFNEEIILGSDVCIEHRYDRGVLSLPIVASITMDEMSLAGFLSYCKLEKLSKLCIRGIYDLFLVKIPDLPQPLFLSISYNEDTTVMLFNHFDDAMYEFRNYFPYWPNQIDILYAEDWVWD